MMRKTFLILLGAASGAALTLLATQPRLVHIGFGSSAKAFSMYSRQIVAGNVGPETATVAECLARAGIAPASPPLQSDMQEAIDAIMRGAPPLMLARTPISLLLLAPMPTPLQVLRMRYNADERM